MLRTEKWLPELRFWELLFLLYIDNRILIYILPERKIQHGAGIWSHTSTEEKNKNFAGQKYAVKFWFYLINLNFAINALFYGTFYENSAKAEKQPQTALDSH